MSLFIITVITKTPPWVWGLLVGLTALGLMQARDHVLTRPRVLLQPALLGAWSLWSASGIFGWHPTVQPAWALGIGLGYALNFALMLPRRVQALPEGRYAIGASWAPLLLILAIFTLRYVVSASLAVVPQLAGEASFAAAASLLYGLPSGLLAARAVRILNPDRQIHAMTMA